MPVKWVGDRNGGPNDPPVEKYCIDDQLMGDAVADALASMRKKHIALQEEMLALQKQFGRDPEWGRFFKEEARHQLRLVRACRLLIPYVANDAPGDCQWVDHYAFPTELWSALNQVSDAAILEAA